MLNSKQRAYLRSLASNLDTIFQIGKGGVSEEICAQLLNALNARELIKIKVLETCPTTVKETAAEDACISVGFTPTQYKIITESDKPVYRARFKILEFFGQ